MDKPLSLFLTNVVKNGSITKEEAERFNQLATPHLQFEAVMALKRARRISPCSDAIPEAHLRSSIRHTAFAEEIWHKIRRLFSESTQRAIAFMANTRWIEVTVLGLAIPLIHTFWVHTPEIKRTASTFATAQPPIFIATASPAPAPVAEPIPAPEKSAFHPKTEDEALSHYMNDPAPLSLPMRVATSDKPSLHLSAQAAEDAESASLNALPVTSRR